MNKRIIIGTLVISLLLCSHVLVLGTTAATTSISKSVDEPSSKGSQGYEIVINETFSENKMPPTGWELINTSSVTWHIDSSYPHSEPYCASVNRGSDSGLRDEWLVTPELNFSQYVETINLSFWWYASCYAAHWKDYVDLNVSVSTNNGSTWTLEWSDDDIVGNYTSWKWFNKNMVLTEYAGENSVRIGFQFYSNITTEYATQEFSIDDVILYAKNGTIELNCNAGGPYEWCWDTQGEYVPAGVRFHGTLVGQQWWKCKWLWDFGDNSTSIIPLSPIHNYASTGVYNVTLTVIDNSTEPSRVAFDYTTIRIFALPPPEIDIQIKPLALGIQAVIENGGLYNATLVGWTMMVRWGIFGEKRVANGTIDRLEPDSLSDTIKSGFFFKFGFIRIELSALPENMPGIIKNYFGLKIGPFVMILKES
jgi:hypothetical protein